MGSRNPHLRPAILLAIETGLRRGELLGLAWRHIDLGGRTAHIPITKNGKARTIPLTAQAVQILQTLSQGSGKVFPLTPVALRLGWERLRCRAGLPDLRFHDLRHEALSRFAELGLSTVELAAISGHQDLRMLSRYTHLRAEDLAAKIASLASP
jgi:integrase